MLRLDQRGVAAVTVVVIIAISLGAAVATPVVVDIADVDPDHPLYGLERLGERIRMVGREDQMKERWGEYVRLVDRGKGLAYKNILEEFVERMREVAPGDVETRQEIVQWMQDQMPGIGKVQLKLSKELCGGLKDDLPEIGEEIDEILDEISNCEEEFEIAELRENARARLRLIREKIENIVKQHKAQIVKPVNIYFDIDNVLVDVDVTVNVEVYINIVSPVPITTAEFEEELEEFDELLAEVQSMLEGTPKNTHGRHVAERLVQVAIKLKEKAVDAHKEGKIRKALVLIYAAKVHLRIAETILDHASEWELEFKNEWTNWKGMWEDIKQELIGEGTWQSILKNYQQYAENVRQRWGEKMHEMGVGGGYSPIPD